MQGSYYVNIRDANGNIVTSINDYTQLHIIDTLNDVGQWSLSSVSDDKCPFQPGYGIVVWRDDVCIYSGFVTTIQDTFDNSTMLHSWQVQGVNDLGLLARRICFVDPATGSTTTYSHFTRSGDIAYVVYELIRLNAGPNAMDARKIPIIVNNGYTSLSINVSVSLRFQNLLAAVTTLCSANNCGVRAVWYTALQQPKVYYEVFKPRDLSSTIYYAEYMNNTAKSEYIGKVPDANWILAGGTGELTARSFATAQNDTSIYQWGRIEVFQDARNQSNLSPYASKVLADKSNNMIGYSVVASDVDNAPQYGVDYLLGDIIGANVMGQNITAQIQQIEITVANGVEHINPKFGTLSLGKFREIFQRMDDMQQNLNELLGVEIA